MTPDLKVRHEETEEGTGLQLVEDPAVAWLSTFP